MKTITITYNPETHVLVPKEPTPEMINEVEHAARLGGIWTAASAYRAMLAAAPQQEAREAEHNSKDRRCECCGYMTYHREHLGCIRAAARTHQPLPAQAEGQEAVAKDWRHVIPGGRKTDQWESVRVDDYNRGWNDYRKAAKAALEQLQTSARQEPIVEFMGRRLTPEGTRECWGILLCDFMQDPEKGTKLYTTPPRREWVGLEEGETVELFKRVDSQDLERGRWALVLAFTNALEAKLKERNHV